MELPLDNNTQVFVIYDRNVSQYIPNIVPGRPSFAITAEERFKTADTVLDICRWLLENGADRDALLLSIGGGITSDITGFAAGIYKRGIRFATVPTTLLAMVDAGIGGKTGVNLDGFKNMLGVFLEPEFTHIMPEVLQTLPEREFRNGAAEMLKTFLVSDGKLYRKAVSVLSEEMPVLGELTPLIEDAVRIKERIVRKDPFDRGIRRILNLGHTWAHAIEWKSKGQTSHGEAVAKGIIAAAHKSEELGLAAEGLADRIETDFRACGLPTRMPFPEEELKDAMLRDKKADGGKISMALLEKEGKAVIVKI